MVVCDPRKETSQIIYGDFGMDSTVVTKFNLICDDQYKVGETILAMPLRKLKTV